MTVFTRILLIDDDAVDRASVRRGLSKSGLNHDLVEAADGTSGLAAARAGSFDCVLLDYRLPDVDTFDLLADLVAPEGGSQAVIMLTGEADGDVALKLMRAGALDYLSKAEATPSVLARAIRYARARREFVAELSVARHEAEAKSLELDTLNRQKTLLFSIIAHDLRNPFQALLGLSTVLAQGIGAKDLASVERRAQGLKEAAGQAYSLMESLFAWASLQMDSVAVELKPVDLADVARETVAGGAVAAADKGLTLRTEGTDVTVLGHRDMLLAVLRNLVGNAIKFTLPGGTITVAGRQLGGAIEVTVTDTGLGMPPNKIDDLFKLDRRVTTVGTAGERGSGLGLLLCRDLVERLGSRLTVRSVVDRGTTFRFSLPMAETVDAG